jgi:hypothetical protein
MVQGEFDGGKLRESQFHRRQTPPSLPLSGEGRNNKRSLFLIPDPCHLIPVFPLSGILPMIRIFDRIED